MICSSNAVISVDDRLHTYFPAFVTRNTLSARVESSQTHESHVTLAVPLLNSTFEFILEENYGMLSGTYVSLELTAEGESSVLTTAEHGTTSICFICKERAPGVKNCATSAYISTTL